MNLLGSVTMETSDIFAPLGCYAA